MNPTPQTGSKHLDLEILGIWIQNIGNVWQMSNICTQPLSWNFDIDAGQDLEKLVRKLSVSARIPETFALLCPKAFKHLAFDLDPKGAKSAKPGREY